uniref:Uncharacterized protein n=1 Tax=Anopheles funestus TaxID=62324 RepID=A0A182RMU5_ANOFN
MSKMNISGYSPKNVSSWERRLSVYWAYLKLVRQYHQKYPESTNIKREEVVALESVNEASKELLCTVQEYRQVTKRQKKQISVEQMQKMVNFTIHDAGEIKIHIWYIMCRLECFLKNMRKHLRQLSAKGNQAYKPVNMMNCKTCPYCKACPYCKPKKQCQQHNKKHRKQTQHQQQQQQQRQHNRAGHSAQQKQANQHQQPSRQPKGRKGTQQPNNHARNKQG